MTSNRRNRLIALVGTLLFHAAILTMIMLIVIDPPALKPLQSPDSDKALDDSEILFGSEYVMVGDVDVSTDDIAVNDPANTATESSAEASDRTSADLADNGPAGEQPTKVTTTKPSPAKETVTPQPEKPGSKTDTKSDKKTPTDKNSQAATDQKVADRTNFGPKDSDKTTGKPGSPDGNASEGATGGVIGSASISGRTTERMPAPVGYGPGRGTIVVSVKVNRQGRVTAVTLVPERSTGTIARDAAARQACLNAARSSQFSVSTDANAPASQSGTITYHFK